MNTASLLLFLVISAAWFCGVKDSWIYVPSVETVRSCLEGALRYSESVITWLDNEGSAVLGTCEEYEEPDRDLYYPDVKHCVKLSDQLSSVVDVLLDYWARIVLFILTVAPDTSKYISSALDELQSWKIWAALEESLSNTPVAVESYLIYVGTSLENTYHFARSHDFELPSSDQITDWFNQFTATVVLFNRASLTLIVTVSCLTIVYVVCYFLSDTDFAYSSKKVTFSTDNSEEDGSRRRPERLARIRPTHTVKKDKGKRKKRQRQRPSSRDNSTDPESCSLNSSFSPRPGSESIDVSHIDDEALRYIVGGATDTAPAELRERIRAALQVIANHEEEECCTQGDKTPGKESSNRRENRPGIIEYDIRYKDSLPSDVMDVLFCIDPKCDHDHGRYELRGCKILVKPVDYKKCDKTNVQKSYDCRKATSSPVQESPVESYTWTYGNKHSSGQVTDDDSKTQDQDPSVQRTDSFPDWTAPAYDQCCPYCKTAQSKKGEEEEEDLYPGDLTPDPDDSPCKGSSQRPHSHDVSGPHPGRPQSQLIELLGEAALEEVIGPPQANSSFQADDEISWQKVSDRGAKKYIHSMDSSPTYSFKPYKRGVDADWSPTFDPRRSVQNYSYTSGKYRSDIEPLSAPIPRVSARLARTPRELKEDASKGYDSVPTFNEAELNLTRELQDSRLNDSQNSIDLAELNRSLSFYGDVSMVELAASWIVRNILDRARNMFSQVKVGALKESVMDISTGVMETLDLLE